MSHRIRRTLSGTVFMVVGTGGVLMLLGWMNEPPIQEKGDTASRSVQFDVQKQVKPTPQQAQPKQKNTRVKKSDRPSPMKPRIGNALANVSLDGFGLLGGMAENVDQNLLGETKDVAMTEETVDSPPVPLQRKAPQIPHQLRKKGISGRVLLQLLINETGHVDELRVLESTPVGVFDSYALDAARSWRFRPGMHNGSAASVWMKAPIEFQYGQE